MTARASSPRGGSSRSTFQARMPDWARGRKHRVSKASTLDSEAVLTDAVVNDGLRGGFAQAFDALRALAVYAEAHADAPSALLEQLAKSAAGFDPARAHWAREKLRARGARGLGFVESVARRGTHAEIVAAARVAMQTGAVEDAG